ncbi:hypothetical protein CERSUDRAFT_99938 [Gelatoporia subvermispora B]|uniref:Uncharacterized protein n=1 Tax=Ceriporiopsis subvermispora (strain B) TaxID=914234 RepID=M2QIQ4_CERS8|nr:hypothetical protein CERSUDRAFT_99938 [Gelatoporia subvermispora B]
MENTNSPHSLPTLDHLLQAQSNKRIPKRPKRNIAALSRTQSASSNGGDTGLPTPPASQQDVLADPTRALMSPPPEEMLRITGRTSTSRARSTPSSSIQITFTPLLLGHTVSSPGTTSTTTKRKRTGVSLASRTAYSDFDTIADARQASDVIDEGDAAVEKTPNPKARKQTKQSAASYESPTHRASPNLEPATPTRASCRRSDSPSQPALFLSPHAHNPQADYFPPSAGPSRRRSTTPAVPYEPPPPDRFTPPREVLYTPATVMSKSSKRKTAPKVKTEKSKLVLSIKKEPPVIDLTSPPPPGSPTDDPLLLSGPPTRMRPRDRLSLYARDTPMRSSTPPIPALDLGADMHMQSFEASDDDDDAIVPVFRFDNVPDDADGGAWTDDEDDYQADGFDHSGEYTGKFKVLTVPTKQDPPSPSTKQRMDAWGRPISPFPWPREQPPAGSSTETPPEQNLLGQPLVEPPPAGGVQGPVIEVVPPSSPLLEDVVNHEPSLSPYCVPSPGQTRTQDPPQSAFASPAAKTSDESVARQSGTKTLGAHQAANSASGEHRRPPRSRWSNVGNKWQRRASPQDAREEYVSERVTTSVPVHDKTVRTSRSHTNVTMEDVTPTNPSIPDTNLSHSQQSSAGVSPSQPILHSPPFNAVQEAQVGEASDDDSEEASVDRELSREPDSDDDLDEPPEMRPEESITGPSQQHERRPPRRDSNAMESDNETLRVGQSQEVEDDSEDSDVLDEGVIKIVSDDPRAAARAAAILKMHDYDCLPHILLRKKRHSHSSAQSVAKAARRKSVSDAGVRKRVAEVHRRRTIGGVVGDTVVFSEGSSLTLPELLQEAERDLAHSLSLTAASPIKADPSPPREISPPAQPQSFILRVLGPHDWLKDDWKLLDACFTDERMAVASAQGQSGEELADVDNINLEHIVERFVSGIGGDDNLQTLGWTRADLRRRAEALQRKQRSGKVAPPTPRMQSPWSVRASAPPLMTPLPRAFPEAATYTRGWSSFDADTSRRRESVHGSLLAPRYSHLMEEALTVSAMETPLRPEPPNSGHPVHGLAAQNSATDDSVAADPSTTDASTTEPFPVSTIRGVERRPAIPQTPLEPENRSIAGRMKGFFSSYIPTLSRSNRAKTMPPPSQLGLPIPPPEIFKQPRAPVVTPASKPPPKSVPPKNLVQLHTVPQTKPAPPPRKTEQPHRLIDLRSAPAASAPSATPVPRDRRASGSSVKDLVKTFEDIRRQSLDANQGLRRARSVAESTSGSSMRQKPAWRP